MVLEILNVVLEIQLCVQLCHFLMLLISHKSFCVLVFACSMYILRVARHLFHCRVKQNKDPRKFGLFEGYGIKKG